MADLVFIYVFVCGFVVKAAESHFAWFCSLLHMSWVAEKAQ